MKLRVAVFVLLLVAAIPSFAATPREALLVDTAWLKQHLHDKNLVLLQVGDKKSFDAGHIAGARQVTLEDISVSEHSATGLILEMPKPDDLKARLEKLGISDDSRVIVYYGKDWVSPTTRYLFTLQYAGLGAHVSMLDGGLGAWTRAGGAVTTEATEPKSGKLSPLKLQPLIVDRDFVRSRIGAKGFAVIDGRAAVFYDGVELGRDHGDVEQRRGHIHGSGSIPYTTIVDDNLLVKPTTELEAMFTKAGVKPGDTVIGYCHIGMQTTAMLMAARILGHPVLLYDGSYQDWSRYPDYPVDDPTKVTSK